MAWSRTSRQRVGDNAPRPRMKFAGRRPMNQRWTARQRQVINGTLLASLISVSLGCGGGQQRTPSPVLVNEPLPAPTIVLETIEIRDVADGTLLEVGANAPLVWTSYRNAGGDFVLELADTVPSPSLATSLTPTGGEIERVSVALDDMLRRSPLGDPLPPKRMTRITVLTRRGSRLAQHQSTIEPDLYAGRCRRTAGSIHRSNEESRAASIRGRDDTSTDTDTDTDSDRRPSSHREREPRRRLLFGQLRRSPRPGRGDVACTHCRACATSPSGARTTRDAPSPACDATRGSTTAGDSASGRVDPRSTFRQGSPPSK